MALGDILHSQNRQVALGGEADINQQTNLKCRSRLITSVDRLVVIAVLLIGSPRRPVIPT